MTTATGDFAIDFAPLGNSDPYTNANLTQFDTGYNVKILTNVLRPSATGTSVFGARRIYYNGTMTAGATVRSTIEIANAGAGDYEIAWAIKTDGTGYAIRASGTAVSLVTVTGVAGSPAFTGLVSGTAASMASGDLLTIEVIPDTPAPGTNTINGLLNGVLISGVTITDATYTGLRPGPGFDAGNTSASTIRSWAGDGITVVVAPSPTSIRLVFVMP